MPGQTCITQLQTLGIYDSQWPMAEVNYYIHKAVRRTLLMGIKQVDADLNANKIYR